MVIAHFRYNQRDAGSDFWGRRAFIASPRQAFGKPLANPWHTLGKPQQALWVCQRFAKSMLREGLGSA